MGDDSMIVRGLLVADGDAPEPAFEVDDIGALGSAPHGAGRQMSRTKAAGKMRNMRRCNDRDCLQVFGKGEVCPVHPEARSSKFRGRDTSTAEIDWPVVKGLLAARDITVLGAGADEAPGAYKRLEEVIALHPNVVVMERLSPIGVVMAGDDIYDPFKD
jgi:tRNA-splicing ligase RtcB